MTTAATPQGASWGTQDGKGQDTGHRKLRCTSKEWHQWAQVLISLTPHVWLSLISSNILLFWLPGFCGSQSSYIYWLLPYLFGAVPQKYLRDCLLGLNLQFCSVNKAQFSTCNLCMFFQLILLILTFIIYYIVDKECSLYYF